MPLNDRQIKNAKPSEKQYKLSDGHSLYVLIKPNGGKYWRFDYTIDGKRKTLSIGTYPTISLAEARQAAEDARRLVANGQSPSEAKQQEKQIKQAAMLHTFEYLAMQWHRANAHRWKQIHADRIISEMQKDVFPFLGQKQIDDISVTDIKVLIDRIAGRGANVTAEKVRQWIQAIYNYAAMLEITDRNPAAPLRGFLAKGGNRHMPALPREKVTEFYQRLGMVNVYPQNRLAVMLVMLVFVRSTELRGGEWSEIDWQAKTWTIPASRMKRPHMHIVPLSDWAIELLRELHGLTGQGRYMFPSRINADGYISEGTLNNIINSLGYKGQATPHGFRSLASSLLNEKGFNPDAIERQLAHIESNKIRAAYNRAEYTEERQTMMQWYSDWLKARYEQAKCME
ncbi:integrase arm-type DNA-binding domain-containing protein [Vitreoscilla massiliensis]|uniref:Integrase arm-type DNA-binding domain-containing protein n=1 Tax=Vitreoscilla massiliensis TaxID=1689272 RepID=A0ABY4E0L6_9NEIS|nr:integrase arm-type DNA-binding domain-containing protein [Vitreoscilla massiliensis]UOO87843.1 integrase arm-type DNA-binding domain-containing protein [Vitreoscilla massiliensis]